MPVKALFDIFAYKNLNRTFAKKSPRHPRKRCFKAELFFVRIALFDIFAYKDFKQDFCEKVPQHTWYPRKRCFQNWSVCSWIFSYEWADLKLFVKLHNIPAILTAPLSGEAVTGFSFSKPPMKGEVARTKSVTEGFRKKKFLCTFQICSFIGI